MTDPRAQVPNSTPRIPAIVRSAGWAAVLVLGALLVVAAWATASPPGSSPDEDFHLTSIWCPTPLDGSCRTRVGADGGTEVSAPHVVVAAAACTAFQEDASGACVDGLGNDPVWASRVDDGLYPGGFYDVMHLFVGDDVSASVTTMRIANGLLAIALFTAVTLLSPASSRRLMTYGFLAVSVPMAVYLIASVNPSGWAFTGIAVAWAAMHGAITQDARGKRYALVGTAVLAAVIAASARADAGAYLGVVSAGVVALHFRTVRRRWRLLVLPAVVTAVGVVGFLSASQTDALGGMDGTAGPGDGNLLFANILELPRLLVGMQTDSLNWFDTPLPAIAWVPLVLLAGALAFLGLRVVDAPKLVALLGMVAVFATLPLLLLQRSGVPVGLEVQSRYIAPLVPVIMATALWNPRTRAAAALTGGQTVLAYLALVGAHSAVLYIQIRRFVTGLDAGWVNLNYRVEWWDSPVSPMATWLVGSLGFAVLALALFLVRRPGIADVAPSSALERTQLAAG